MIFTLIVATPFLFVLALKVFLFTLIVITLPATALPLDFKVTLIFLAFLTFNVAFLAVRVVAFLAAGAGVGVGAGAGFAFTVIFALPIDASYWDNTILYLYSFIKNTNISRVFTYVDNSSY